MSQTLYRKYRPQIWREMIGQNHIKVTLQHEIEAGKLAHAYLFCGPRGLGKTTAARLLAKSLNCLNRKEQDSEPCNTCHSCQDIVAGKALDLIEIDAASQTGVDNVRENIIQNARFTPNVAKYKIFIIDEVHMLSTSSFNALLKTLEEPPAHAVFILCTTEVHKIPETIISRCQRFDFRRVGREELQSLLISICQQETREVDPEVLAAVVRQSEGCVRDAETLLGKILSLEGKITREVAEIVLPRSDFALVLELLKLLAVKETVAALLLVNRLVEEGVDLINFNQDTVEVLRKILLLKNSSQLADLTSELSPELEKELAILAEALKINQVVEWLNLFINLRSELKHSQIIQLPLELAVVTICQAEEKALLAANLPITNRPQETSAAKTEVKKIPTKEKNSVVKSIKSVKQKITLNNIKERWPTIIQKVLEHSYPLASLLKISQPIKLVDNCLEIGLKYQFYADRLHDRKHQQILDGVSKEVLGTALNFRGTVVADVLPLEFEETPKKDSSLTTRVLEVMGGEVVE